MSQLLTTVPYCGTPPDPGELWTRWRFDTLVLIALVAGAISYWRASRHIARPEKHFARIVFAAGWVTTTVALVSPLCALSVSLFVARAAQHTILTMLAAPLIALSLRALATRAIGGASSSATRVLSSPLAAAFTFAAVVWFWHTPAAYMWTFDSVIAYWTMHVTMFASACWLWVRLLHAEQQPLEGLLASLLSTVQMGFLGALITLSPRAFYGPHFATTAAWGLTPLQDQQAGGVVMWVLGCVAFLLVTIGTLGRLVHQRHGHALPIAGQHA